MPAHLTHKLQPLDVELFAPLLTVYLKQINKIIYQSFGLVSMSKQFFYQVFKEAWNKAFTHEYIVNAFEKTRIWLLNPDKVLSTL
jgi:hypothetical protein